MTIDDEKLRLWLEAAVESAFRAGASEERASVVAWLREEYDTHSTQHAALHIERGEHREER